MTACSYVMAEGPCPKPATMAVITRARYKTNGRDVWVEAHADVEAAPAGADPHCSGHGLQLAIGVLAALGVADG